MSFFPERQTISRTKHSLFPFLVTCRPFQKTKKLSFLALTKKNDFVRFSWTFALKWLCLVINNSYVNVSVKHTVGLLSTFTVVTQYVSSKEDITQYVRSRVSQFRKDMQSDI